MKYFFVIFLIFLVSQAIVCLNYGAGDWAIFEHWITNDRSCYNFIDSQPYDLARFRLKFDSKKNAFNFPLDIHECVQLAVTSEKILIFHTDTLLTQNQLNTLSKKIGDFEDAVWLFYELPLIWNGHILFKPFKTVITGIKDFTENKYSQSDLDALQKRLSILGSSAKKGVQLNSDLIKQSKSLNWQPLINSVDYTIIYKDNKTGEVKDAILNIIHSSIHATIWDTEKLDSYGTSKKLQWWPQQVFSKLMKALN